MSDHPLVKPLQFCAGIVLVITVLATLAVALDRGQLPDSIRSRALPAAICLAAGTGLCAIILGIMAMLDRNESDPGIKRLLTEIRDHLKRQSLPVESTKRPDSPLTDSLAAGGQLQGTDTARIIQLLDEIREISLLTQEQRSERYERMLGSRRQGAAAAIESLIAQSRWTEAKASLQQAMTIFGEAPELLAISERLNHAVIAAEQAAFAELQQKVRDLQATDNWAQAIAESEAFVQRFPDSAPGLEFQTTLIQSRDNHIDLVANSLYEEIKLNIEQRSWRKALTAAEKLLAKCPDHHRAQQVQVQMQVIRDNAETEQRNSMETRIHELVKAGRFREAIDVAEDLIRSYPLSPQAEIASQLALKLREKLEREQTATA